MSLCLGYCGPIAAPEFVALRSRNNCSLAALCATDDGDVKAVVEATGARLVPTAEELVERADLDAAFVNLRPAETARVAVAAAGRGLHVFLVPPVASSSDEAASVRQAVEGAGIITSVGWPMRYAINLIQLRHHVRRGGAQWMFGRVVTTNADRDAVLQRTGQVCDLVRYVGGAVAEEWGVAGLDQNGLHAWFRLWSGGTAHLSVLAGVRTSSAEEASIEVLTNGDRMAWFFGTNHAVVNGTEQRVAEKVEGLYVAEVAAFLTAVETGWRSPILSDYADAAETLAMTERLRAAWEEVIG